MFLLILPLLPLRQPVEVLLPSASWFIGLNLLRSLFNISLPSNVGKGCRRHRPACLPFAPSVLPPKSLSVDNVDLALLLEDRASPR